jgi:plasmid maintenance system antidote protein VapI
MNNYKIAKKLMKEMDPEDIVESFLLPAKLTKKQKEESDRLLAEARKQYRAQLTKKDYLKANLLQLRFQLQDYIKAETYDPDKRFGNFLKAYLLILNKKSTELASEIKIHETLVSQLINNHRDPNEDIMIRLELHSNNNIPAHYWFMLVQKDRINQLKTDKELRKREKKFVTYKVKV